MNNLFAALAVILLNVYPAHANDHEYKNSPEYMRMEKDTRESLKNCLNSENIKTKDCVKNYKKMRKSKKKEIEKMYKEKSKN